MGWNGDCGGETALLGGRTGEEGSDIWGGADIDLRVLRGPTLVLDALGFTGEGRTGEEDSAPDWKMLLSSQPLSSPDWLRFRLKSDRKQYKTDDMGNTSALLPGSCLNKRLEEIQVTP